MVVARSPKEILLNKTFCELLSFVYDNRQSAVMSTVMSSDDCCGKSRLIQRRKQLDRHDYEKKKKHSRSVNARPSARVVSQPRSLELANEFDLTSSVSLHLESMIHFK